ncbi:MAG: hypothetical protein ABII96_11655 [Candidatus Zixiibacteriota bacterium]
MNQVEEAKRYKFFGTELRIFFWLVSALFFLAAVFGFKNSIWFSMFFLLLLILLVLFIRWDSAYHLVIITPEKLVFERVIWQRLTTSFTYIPWGEVEKVTTIPGGPFNLLKVTQIESRGHAPIKVYSFMEDYLHFLKDLTRQADPSRVDKLTADITTGRADV